MAELELNAKEFWGNLERTKKIWMEERESDKENGTNLKATDAIVIIVGNRDKESKVKWGETFQKLLFSGVLITKTILILSEKKAFIISGASKIKVLKQLNDKKPENACCELELIELVKNDTDAAIQKGIEAIQASFDGKKIGTLLKGKAIGPFAEQWEKTLEKKGIESVECRELLEDVMMPDGATNFGKVKKAGDLLTRALKKVFVKTMTHVFSEDQEISNKKVQLRLDEHLTNPAKMKAQNVDKSNIEKPYPSTVQSGGDFDSKIGAPSTEKNFSSDVLLCQMPIVYDNKHCVIGRTFFVNPTASQKERYKLILKAEEEAFKLLRPGAILGEVYDKVAKLVKEGDEELFKNMPKSIGFGSGGELKFSSYSIESGNTKTVKTGHEYVVTLGFDNVLLPSDKEKKRKKTIKDGKHSFLLSDTLVVKENENVVVTKTKTNWDNIHYDLEEEEDDSDDDDDDDDDEEEEDNDDLEIIAQYNASSQKGGRVTRSRTKTPEQLRAEKEQASLEAKINAAQDKLMKSKAKKALKKDADNQDGDGDEDEEEEELLQVYENTKQYPQILKRNQIEIDKESEVVFLPIGGYHVAFHISTIKTIIKTEEEHATLLRFTFYYPTGGSSFAKDVPAQMKTVMTQYPQLHYIKEMSFRSKTARNLNHQFRLIKEMQKRRRARQKTQEMEADLVEQADLVISRDMKRRPPQLDDVSMRPSLRKGKCVGSLQAHTNGLRFRTNRRETLDIIYSNIKHFFFQECKNELTVLIHFHLKNPVMLGRSKTYDVQFFTEVVEGSSALDGKRRSMHDPDEEEEERREHLLKKRLNSMFRKFCSEVIKTVRENDQRIGTDDDFDMPYRKLAFQGVPFKEMVWLIPTVNCLVNLTESPFFVVTLDEIEHVHFERVNNHSKNFDMVLILKSQMKPGSSVPKAVTSIPIESLETIRRWLYDKGDITFTVGSSALNWKTVMESVYNEIDRGIFWKNEDEEGTKKDIGWNFLRLEDEAEEGEEGEESGSEFGEDDQESSGGEDEDDYEDAVDDDEEESSSAPESDEEGEDWDDLEEQAARSDAKKNKRDLERDEVSRRKKARR